MNTLIKLPFYAKTSLIFLGLFAFVSMLYVGQRIIVPVIYSTIIAIVLSPMVNFLTHLRMNRILAITITLIVAIAFVLAVVAFLCTQGARLSDSFPALREKFSLLTEQTVSWVSHTFKISESRLNTWLNDLRTEVSDSSGSALGQTLIYTGNFLIILILIPVYIFMILFYQPLLLEFVHKLFRTQKQGEVNEVLTAIKRIIQNYLVGLLIEAFLIASMNSISLLILGIDYAILLGVIGAIVNIIPYIGGILGVSLPFLLALATKPTVTNAMLVLVAYMIIQFIDNHYIVPKIVASKVKINALVSIIVVLAGSALWGIPGMLLSIPLTAIIKVICDHIVGLEPWGFLLGDTMPGETPVRMKIRRRFFRSKMAHQK